MRLVCRRCGNCLSQELFPSGHLKLRDTGEFAACTLRNSRKTRLEVTNRKYPKLKEVDDVLGGAAAWENVDSTPETCPKCEHPRAYFMQIQTRSADEPMTTFYKCCNQQCGHRWRD
nr:PREDICTED: DNA-directed RNA polymerase III subunit RPC10 isoform X1 [Lepisosteus oculatus]